MKKKTEFSKLVEFASTMPDCGTSKHEKQILRDIALAMGYKDEPPNGAKVKISQPALIVRA